MVGVLAGIGDLDLTAQLHLRSQKRLAGVGFKRMWNTGIIDLKAGIVCHFKSPYSLNSTCYEGANYMVNYKRRGQITARS